MKFIWNGNVYKLSNIIFPKRILHAYGITIGWLFFGIMIARKNEIDLDYSVNDKLMAECLHENIDTLKFCIDCGQTFDEN